LQTLICVPKPKRQPKRHDDANVAHGGADVIKWTNGSVSGVRFPTQGGA
jgi:hypothetical protein